MTLPTRWNPMRQLGRFDPLDDFASLFRGMGATGLAHEYERAMEMRLDVNEDDREYVVNVDMPGVRKEDIDISVAGNQVTISAEVKREKERGKGKELYSERYSGKAYRAFTLPLEVDGDQAKAGYDGGVLTLTLPKKAASGSRHVDVH